MKFFSAFKTHHNASAEGQGERERPREEGTKEGVHGEQGLS